MAKHTARFVDKFTIKKWFQGFIRCQSCQASLNPNKRKTHIFTCGNCGKFLCSVCASDKCKEGV